MKLKVYHGIENHIKISYFFSINLIPINERKRIICCMNNLSYFIFILIFVSISLIFLLLLQILFLRFLENDNRYRVEIFSVI